MRRPLASSSSLVLEGGRVLLVKRGREPEPGSWSLPAGLVEHGETAEEAAVRETLEETGVEISIEGLLGIYDLIGRGYHYVVICFLSRPVGGKLRKGPDIQEARWFKIEDLGELVLMSVTREALRDAGLLPT